MTAAAPSTNGTASDTRATGGTRRFSTAIVGFGHAGARLHHRCIAELGSAGHPSVLRGTVLVVDPEKPPTLPAGAAWSPSLGRLLENGRSLQDVVFHVTTPVRSHAAAVARLLGAGAARIIVEKPLAVRTRDAEAMVSAARARGAELLPVAVWPSSLITQMVLERVEAGAVGDVDRIWLEQSKPRFQRTLESSGHRSAIEIELPHQLVLAMHLAGRIRTLRAASVWPMAVDGLELPMMGGVAATFEHESGVVSSLVSDLTSPVRRRRLTVAGSRGKLSADYPLGADEPFGRVTAPANRIAIARDQPLTAFVDRAYRFFAGLEGRPPGTSLDVHLEAVSWLERVTAEAREVGSAEEAAPLR